MTATAAESEWVVEDRVPIYDQHVWEDADPTTGKVHRVPVTKERLQKIANARNEQIARTGNMAPILVGHSRLDLPEYAKAKWSPTVGWADNFEVGDHPDDGRPTMYARHKFYPTAEVGGETMTAREIMRRFPHRSVEVHLGRNTLDAISLLAPGNTPMQEHGLLRLEASANPTATASEAPMGDRCDELISALMAVLEQFAGGQQNAADPAAAPPGAPGGAAPMPEGPGPQQYAACGPANAALPETPEKVRMQANQDAIRETRENARVKQLETDLASLKLQYQRERREKDLIQLEAEGYDFDRSEELADLTPLADDAYAKALDRIKKRYQRVPAGREPIRTAAVPEGGSDNSPFARGPYHDAAHDIMWNNPGMSWDEAKRQAQAG
jgi:hypothetical protein